MNSRFFLLFLAFLGLSCSSSVDDDKHRIVQFRTIGHQLLLACGDSTSRILPVEKTNPNTYRITFEQQFEIMPDSLANIVIKNLKNSDPKIQYRVSVFTCNKPKMVYGFEWSSKSTDDITCMGRKLPNNCYWVEIEVLESNNSLSMFWILVPLVLIGIGVFFMLRKKTKKEHSFTKNEGDSLRIGAFDYYQKTAVLVIEYQKIELSDKENKLLNLLLEKPNETVSREYLLKEIWENEGVFVISRNLDVLVSKLRKKLAADPAIKITNSHGKGYKLEV
jgi:hypothetical protein